MAVEKIEDETGVKFVLSADRHQIVNAIRVAIESFETNADSLESVFSVRSDYSAERILAKLRMDGFTYREFDGEPAPTVEDAMNQWIDGQTTIHLGIERTGWVPCAGIEIRQGGDGWAVSVRRWPDTPAICLPGVNALISWLEIELDKLAPATGGEPDKPSTAEGKTLEGDELLTDREREIVHFLADGRDDKEIADGLVIAPATVKKHRQNIEEKWGVSGGMKTLQVESKRRGYGRVGKDTL